MLVGDIPGVPLGPPRRLEQCHLHHVDHSTSQTIKLPRQTESSGVQNLTAFPDIEGSASPARAMSFSHTRSLQLNRPSFNTSARSIVPHGDYALACQRCGALCALRSKARYADFAPAATSTSAGATNPIGVSKILSVSATSVHAATRTASGL